jgi:hypothetical protein
MLIRNRVSVSSTFLYRSPFVSEAYLYPLGRAKRRGDAVSRDGFVLYAVADGLGSASNKQADHATIMGNPTLHERDRAIAVVSLSRVITWYLRQNLRSHLPRPAHCREMLS